MHMKKARSYRIAFIFICLDTLDECVGEDKLYAIESSVLGSYFEAMSLCPAFQEPFGTERNHNVASILDGLVTAHPR